MNVPDAVGIPLIVIVLLAQAALTPDGKPVADPFLIASAKINKTCLITEEVFKNNAPKIPTICQHFGIAHINAKQFLIDEGFKF